MELITADLGSFNIKSNLGIVLENRFEKDNGSDTFGAEVLSWEGNNYFFGRGEFNKTLSKAHKEIEIPLFYLLGKSKVDGEVNLILHLPAEQMPMKKMIIDKLQGKSFTYKVNGNEYSVSFKKVGVLKEGWASFYSLAKRNQGLISVIDIGGRTTDIFTFANGISEQEKSLQVGTMDLFEEIACKLNGEGQNRKIEDIHKLLTHDIIKIEDFQEIVEHYAKKIINGSKLRINNLQDYKIDLTGGGAKYFVAEFNKEFDKVEIMTNNLCSNCTGSLNIGKAKGFDK